MYDDLYDPDDLYLHLRDLSSMDMVSTWIYINSQHKNKCIDVTIHNSASERNSGIKIIDSSTNKVVAYDATVNYKQVHRVLTNLGYHLSMFWKANIILDTYRHVGHFTIETWYKD